MEINEGAKVEAAVRSIQEFEQMLNQIREQAWNEGYAAGLQDTAGLPK